MSRQGQKLGRYRCISLKTRYEHSVTIQPVRAEGLGRKRMPARERSHAIGVRANKGIAKASKRAATCFPVSRA